MAKKSYIQAITDGLDILLDEDPKTLIFGEDVGKNGGVFRTTQGLQEKYGEDRVFDTPLAESGILGLAVGVQFQKFNLWDSLLKQWIQLQAKWLVCVSALVD